MVESNYKALEVNVEGSSGEISEYPNIFQSDSYKDIVYFLQNMNCPPEMVKSKRRAFKLKAIKYCIMENNLYWKDPTGILLKCVDEEEAQRIMTEMHAGACGGHMYSKSIVNKILKAGYYWPTLFSDVYAKIRACIPCKKFEGKHKLLPLPLIQIGRAHV